MSVFYHDKEKLNSRVRSLQLDILRSPIELQLVWLFELLMIITFLKSFDEENKFVIYNEESDNYFLAEANCYTGYDRYYHQYIERLKSFRDLFVHHGFAKALPTFYSLLDFKKELNELAAIAEVTLNFNNRLF